MNILPTRLRNLHSSFVHSWESFESAERPSFSNRVIAGVGFALMLAMGIGFALGMAVSK